MPGSGPIEFRSPKQCDTVTFTGAADGLTGLLSSVGSEVKAGTTRVRVQNLSTSDNIEWSWTGGTPTTGNMGIISPLDVATFSMQAKDYSKLKFIGVLTNKAFIFQEGAF